MIYCVLVLTTSPGNPGRPLAPCDTVHTARQTAARRISRHSPHHKTIKAVAVCMCETNHIKCGLALHYREPRQCFSGCGGEGVCASLWESSVSNYAQVKCVFEFLRPMSKQTEECLQKSDSNLRNLCWGLYSLFSYLSRVFCVKQWGWWRGQTLLPFMPLGPGDPTSPLKPWVVGLQRFC